MTKEEAIEWLKSLNYCDGEETQEVAQAIDMAIKALEQQSDDCVSRQAGLDAITEIDGNVNMDIYTNEVREIINGLPPVTPTHSTCKDCIHRDPEDKMCDCGHTIRWQLPREDNWYCADFKKRGSENDIHSKS